MAGVSLCSVCVGQAGWQCPGLACQGKECPACATMAVMWTPAVRVSPSHVPTVPMPPGIGRTWSNTCARTLARDRFHALCAITGRVIGRRSGSTSCATNETDKPSCLKCLPTLPWPGCDSISGPCGGSNLYLLFFSRPLFSLYLFSILCFCFTKKCFFI